MRQGFRVIDSDTHVNPSLDVLLHYADQELRERIDDLGPHRARGLYRAYHRYMAEYCAADPRRLKSMVLALGTDPKWAAETIAEHAREDWVAAVWPLLPEGLPIDDPDLEPIWAAADDADLAIMYHGFTIETPYFPGYRDVWDNPAMGRCAGQTWGGQRFLSFMLMGGDRKSTRLNSS